jgi:hypothetical protein
MEDEVRYPEWGFEICAVSGGVWTLGFDRQSFMSPRMNDRNT